jgi:hypothetical protein
LTLDHFRDRLMNPHWGEQLVFTRRNELRIAMLFQGLGEDQARATWQPFIDALGAASADLRLVAPPAIVARLANDTRKALQSADVRAALARDGTEAVGSTPEEFAAFINTELARWGKVVRLSGARVD